MANATDMVRKAKVPPGQEFIKLDLSGTAAERTFWPGAMLGLALDGYVDKFDDTQSMLFVGVFDGNEGKLVQPIESDGTQKIRVQQPPRFELTVSSIAITDVGKKVYAIDDQTGTLDASTRTYANVVGTVVAKTGTNIALVEPCYTGQPGNYSTGAARWMGATGSQTLTKYDLGKKIFCPNTAGYDLITPAIADTQAGDEFVIIKTTSDAAAVTINPPSSETVDGSTTLATIDAQYDCATIVSTGAGWIVTSRDIA